MTATRTPIGVGVIGLGVMGATHVRAYQAARPACRLVAVSDQSPERLAGGGGSAGNLDAIGAADRLFNPSEVRGYGDPGALLADADVQVVSICTPTDTHVDLAIAALRAGKHVLCEKPVALASAEVGRIAQVARETGRLCMPAMCMRFWPGWDWLRERIVESREGKGTGGGFGRVLSATFHRLGSPPTWNREFYADESRTGGALFDLHIHDADFIRWCFGTPREVVSMGSTAHVTTNYRYDGTGASDGPRHVMAEGGQDHAPGFGFKMRYVVAFEHATVDWDLSRTPQLLLSREGVAEPIELAAGAGYDGEVRHILDAIARGLRNDQLDATIDDAVETTRLLEAERESLRTGRAVGLK